MFPVSPRAVCSRIVPPAREHSALRFLSAFKGCFPEAEPTALLTPPCHFYTCRLSPSNLFFFFFFEVWGGTENLLKANHSQDHIGLFVVVVSIYHGGLLIDAPGHPNAVQPGVQAELSHTNPCPNVAG